MKRPRDCNCRCEICDIGPVTLKGFAKSDGALLWQHWLENPVLSSDDYIYGYAFEADDSDEAYACSVVPLSGAGAGGDIRISPDLDVTRYRKWIRKLDLNGVIIADSTFYWYTGDGGPSVDDAIECGNNATPSGSWLQDLIGATSDGELLNQYGSFSTGTTLNEKLIVWDTANSTTTRRYTFVGAPVRDLSTPPVGGAKMRFIAENDGTNAQQTIDVPDMIGITAADLATALEAFPHIVSATGTGGPYPFVNIELEVEWAQSTTHFKEVERLTATCRAVRTWLRDWDTAEITATLADPTTVNSSSTFWQLTEDDEIIGIGNNPATVVGGVDGIAVDKFTRSGSAFTQAWRTRPTVSFGPVSGPTGRTRALYERPAIRNGVLLVGHDNTRGADQGSGESSEWHEIDLSTGALTSNGGKNDAVFKRPTFAADDQLIAMSWDGFKNNTYDGTDYQCDRAPTNCIALMDSLSGYTEEKFGPYGQAIENQGTSVSADTTAMYSCRGFLPATPSTAGGWNQDTQKIIHATTRTLATIHTKNTIGDVSKVASDSFFSLATYYRIQHSLQNPINHRWIDSGMEWRAAFFSAADPSASANPTSFTDWLAFTADETDFLNALLDLLGNNDDGPNAFVDGPLYPQTADEPCPQMIWQRGITVTLPAENSPVPWNLNNRAAVRYMYIQVKAAANDAFTLADGFISRMDWDTGDVIWNVPFGAAVSGGADSLGYSGVLNGDQYIVHGPEVAGSCFSLYRWDYTEPFYLGWVLVASYCPTGKTPEPPEEDGTEIGELQYGTCV